MYVQPGHMYVQPGHMYVQPGHMYVQATNLPLSAWTYVCPTPSFRLDICVSKLITGVGHTSVQPYGYIGSLDIRMSNLCFQLGHTYVQPGHTYVQSDSAYRHIHL